MQSPRFMRAASRAANKENHAVKGCSNAATTVTVVENATTEAEEEVEAAPKVTPLPIRRRKASNQHGFLLGLQRVDDPNAPIVPVQVGSSLGRTRKSPPPQHVDLGLTTANAIGTYQVSCVVESITRQHMVLTIPRGNFQNTKNQLVKTCRLLYRKNKNCTSGNKPQAQYLYLDRLVLELGDELIFHTKPGDKTLYPTKYLDHAFRVVKIEETEAQLLPPPSPILEESRIATEASSPMRVTWSSSKRKANESYDRIDVTADPPPRKKASPAKNNNNNKNNNNKKDEKPEQDSFALPWTVHLSTESENMLPTQSELNEMLQRERIIQNVPMRKQHTKVEDGGDDDAHDSEDNDDHDGRPYFQIRDMHVTMANTFGKALHSDTPCMGANLFHLLLNNRRLPTHKLCNELVQLTTFGCLEGEAPQKHLQASQVALASKYLEDFLYHYPAIAHDRIAAAAGSDFWMNVMDQLYTLPYGDDSKSLASIERSINFQTSSLRLLQRLLEGVGHRTATGAMTGGPLMQYLRDYGESAACKIAARAIAHVWGELGHHLVYDSPLTMVVNEWMDLLGSILTLMLNVLVVSPCKSGGRKNKVNYWTPAVDIVWNACSDKLAESKVTTGKNDVRQLKLLWIESFPQDELQHALAKRLGMKL